MPVLVFNNSFLFLVWLLRQGSNIWIGVCRRGAGIVPRRHDVSRRAQSPDVVRDMLRK